jgi:hypothetical protein
MGIMEEKGMRALGYPVASAQKTPVRSETIPQKKEDKRVDL